MLISEVMTTELIISSPDQSLKHAAQIMEINDFDALPVCTNSRLVGTITIRDIVVKAVENGLSLDQISISEVMSGQARYVFEDQQTSYALKFMNEHQLSRLLVLNRENHLVGIASLEDILNSDSTALLSINRNQISVSKQTWPEVIKRPRKREKTFDLIPSQSRVISHHST